MVLPLHDATAMKLHKPLFLVVMGITSIASAETTKGTDAEASRTLDSVLEHVVTGPTLSRVRNVAQEKGSIEVTKSDGVKPTIKGALVVGKDGDRVVQRRTIDWNFGTNVGSFESVRTEGTKIEKVVVKGERTRRHQEASTTGEAAERRSVVDIETVTLVSGGTADIVRSDERITVASGAAAVQYEAQARGILTGYSKASLPGGGAEWTKRALTVGGQAVTDAELAVFRQKRVAR